MKNKLKSFLSRIEAEGEAVSLRHGVSLRELTTMRVGGIADIVVLPKNKTLFCNLLGEAYALGIPFAVLGNGSNIIAGETPYEGVIFSTRGLKKIELIGTKIKADCGTGLNELVLVAAKACLSGIERLYGIPGTVGGALKMNAGAHGQSFADCLLGATLFSFKTGRVFSLSAGELALSYRKSLLQEADDLVVLDATLCLAPRGAGQIKQEIAKVIELRRESQPLGQPSAGSVFRRPAADKPAWRYIEACGLRGRRIGGAQVSPKHAGFIVNTGDASAGDVLSLVGEIQSSVFSAFGVRLMPEVEFFHLSEEEKCRLPIL